MQFHSILFPSAAQEARAKDCPWLTLCARRLIGEEQVVTRGNKTFSVSKDNLIKRPQTPAFFADTGLDQILDSILPDADDVLHGVYYALATDADTVRYRQQILRALEEENTAALFLPFCRAVEGAVRTITDGQTVHSTAQADKLP